MCRDDLYIVLGSTDDVRIAGKGIQARTPNLISFYLIKIYVRISVHPMVYTYSLHIYMVICMMTGLFHSGSIIVARSISLVDVESFIHYSAIDSTIFPEGVSYEPRVPRTPPCDSRASFALLYNFVLITSQNYDRWMMDCYNSSSEWKVISKSNEMEGEHTWLVRLDVPCREDFVHLSSASLHII